MPRPLNVLLITADQWRGDCLSAAGHPHVRTPHLDALAAGGVRFARHFANAAPCAPARASLYTGLYPMGHRVCGNGTPLDARHDNVALAARRAGYAPVLFGHTDVAIDPRTCDARDPRLRDYEGVLPGFDARLPLGEDERQWRAWARARGIDLPPDHPHRAADGVDDSPAGRPPVYDAAHAPTAFVVDEFLRWREGHRLRDDPRGWFAHLSLLRPHPPFVAPPPFDRMVSAADIAPGELAGEGRWEPAAAMHPYVDFVGREQRRSTFVAGAEGAVRDWSPDDLRQLRATYFGAIGEVDAQLGRVLEALERDAASEDTVVVFTSDHGEMLGDHGLLGKFGFHDGSYHVPLIVRDPRRADGRGRVVEAFTESIDVMPTLLEMLELPLPPALDGASLVPWLLGDSPPWRSAVHWEHDFRDVPDGRAERALGLDACRCNLAVRRTAELKYVHFAGLPPLLFDLVADPAETRDLSREPAWLERRLEQAEALLAWRAAHLDQTLALGRVTPAGWLSVPRGVPFRTG